MNLQKNIQFIFTAYLILLTTYSISQEHRNSGFVKPMNLPFNLAGSFGEPRKDHFHSGIDIKTNGVEGELIFAIGDGYISRIRVSPYGYGRAIYITHTNGYTSVYGHLSKFYGKLESYIQTQHYALQKSELDIYLDANKFPVKQNDTIAFSGNTGGSSAPHLHFEIRDSKTEHALNPLDFYPRSFYVDTIAPQINKVKIYQFDSIFGDSQTSIFELKKKENYQTTINPVIINQNTNFCISIEGFDKQDTSENKNGIKKIEVFQKDSLVFKYDLNEIDFDKTRMCNAFVDYDEMMNDNGYFYNCYQLNGNLLPIYNSLNNGFFKIKNNDSTNLKIVFYDYNQNKNEIRLSIYRIDTKDEINSTVYSAVKQALESAVSSSSSTKLDPYTINTDFEYGKKDSIKNNSIKINFPKYSFYDNVSICLNSIKIDKEKTFNKQSIYTLDKNIPLQKPAKIEIKSSIKKDRNKIIIIRQDNKEKETALKTTFDKTKFYADTKELGTFYLKYDTTIPTINISNLSSQISQYIQAKILDNLSGINTYNGYIDDKWVNFYYDAKNDLIQYNFDEYCTKGEHTLKIIVTDNVGNKNTIIQKFNY